MTNWFVLAGLFLCFEAANFTGFSWSHLRRLSDDELISIAVRFKYPRVYMTMEEFRADYSKFKPEVFYWEDFTDDQPNQFWSKFSDTIFSTSGSLMRLSSLTSTVILGFHEAVTKTAGAARHFHLMAQS